MRNLQTPTRAAMKARYTRFENMSAWVLGLEVAVGVFGFLFSQEQWGQRIEWWLMGWVVLIAGAGTFWPFFGVFFSARTELTALKETTTFGVHTKATLQAVVRTACQRLRVPISTRVFVTREKEINAYALRSELLPGWRLFNGVMLNRGLIHLLSERELASVVGHELGHVWRYAPLLTRVYAIHALAAIGLSLGVLALPLVDGELRLMVPFGAGFLTQYISHWPIRSLQKTLEFLCDDVGVEASDWLSAIQTDVKLAYENERRQVLMKHVLQAKADGSPISWQRLLELNDAVLPFGESSQPGVKEQLERLLRRERQPKWRDFYRFLSGANDAEAENAQLALAVFERCEALPLVPFERSRLREASTEEAARELVHSIEANPACVLARLPVEVSDSGLSHPSSSRRVLAMYRNHHAEGQHGTTAKKLSPSD